MTLALDSHTSTISAAESHGSLASLARRYQAALRSIHAGTASLLADGERAVDVERRLRDVLAHRDEGAGEEQDEQEMRRVALAGEYLSGSVDLMWKGNADVLRRLQHFACDNDQPRSCSK